STETCPDKFPPAPRPLHPFAPSAGRVECVAPILTLARRGKTMPPPTTGDEFLEIVRKSDVADEARLAASLAGSPPIQPAALAERPVREGVLTTFHAEMLLQGKWRRFRFGPFRVMERLGVGQTAALYLCEHTGMQRRRVAIKVLPSSASYEPAQ